MKRTLVMAGLLRVVVFARRYLRVYENGPIEHGSWFAIGNENGDGTGTRTGIDTNIRKRIKMEIGIKVRRGAVRGRGRPSRHSERDERDARAAAAVDPALRRATAYATGTTIDRIDVDAGLAWPPL
ncbi:hypothetical protein EVAR_12094_1 [Eumeta japonica]|uniref:Uncharacterized protein n=1 Tax=Eumeta variegata TaxID=151549 RepID=A0A4C1U528_EUMVA|nr:hypothetical protein EVAR_12094_1 [Eumeta japonica]